MMDEIIDKLQEWEDSKAPLSSYQRSVCLDIAEKTSERLISGNFDEGLIKKKEFQAEDNVSIKTSAQFFQWYLKINDEWKRKANSRYTAYLRTLRHEYKKRNELLTQVNDAMKETDELKIVCDSILEKTRSVHDAGEKLIAEEEKLKNVCVEIDKRLNMFTKAENLFAKGTQSFSVKSDNFIQLLNDIDECLEYFQIHETYVDSKVHSIQTRSVLNQALDCLKKHVITNLDTCQSTTAENVNSSKTLDKEHASKYIEHYSRFHTVAARLKPVINQVENRLETNPEYEVVLMDIQRYYVSLRSSIIQPTLQADIAKLLPSKVGDYCSLLRSLTTLLVHLSTDEDKLYYQFFSRPSVIFGAYVESLCSAMYDSMRPLIIHIKHLETLAEICSILRIEILQDRIRFNPALEPFGKISEQLLQDVQERLVFRAHLYFKTDILEFHPSGGDLAYPEMLAMMKNIAEEIKMQEVSNLSRSESRISLNSISSVGDSIRSSASRYTKPSNSSTADLQGMWYPTVRRTLVCLSRLYRCIEKPIFQGLAQEAIECCTDSIIIASRMISNNKTAIDGYLFEIRHLLILREQVAPFQVDFTVKETKFDFQQLRSVAYNLLHKNNSIFSFTSSNALLDFLVNGSPLLRENCLDSRKIVDKQLKNTCESFINHVTQFVVGSLHVFLDKVENYCCTNEKKTENQNSSLSLQAAASVPLPSPTAPLLRQQEFADPQNVRSLIQDSVRKVKTFIPELHNTMALYLANADTQLILYKPAKNNIVAAFAKTQIVINEHYAKDDQLLIGCPNVEQISIQLSSFSLISRKSSIDKPVTSSSLQTISSEE